MKTISQTLIIALCALSSLSVSAHGMHKSKPLSFEEIAENLPAILYPRGCVLPKSRR